MSQRIYPCAWGPCGSGAYDASSYGRYVPVYNLNIPGGGPQGPPMFVPSDSAVYSSYTGGLVGYGGVPHGTMNDAPPSHPNFGNPFHVVEFNPANGSYMAHGNQK